MDRTLTADLRDRLGPDSPGGVLVAAGPLDREGLETLASELGARLAVLDGPTSKTALLQALAAALDFPHWFGWNWDALNDLLSAPQPSDSRPTLIAWTGADRLGARDAATFRSIAEAAAEQRRDGPDGPLVLLLVERQAESSGKVAAEAASAAGGAAIPDKIRHLGKVHHVALIVRSIDASLGLWRDMLGLDLETVMDIPHDRVRIAFLGVGESKVELVEPTDATTGVARFLESKGEGFHHVCFEVANLAETLIRLELDGVELIDSAPRRGAEGPVAFLHPRSCHGVLVELIEAPGGPAWTSLGFS